MGKKIITIGRQFGSGGRAIGKGIAEKLNIPFYDKELLKEAAKHSGVCEELLHQLDEKPSKSLLYSIVMDPYAFAYNAPSYNMNLNQQAFKATYDTIKKIADEGSCVIVGRCSDYILRDNDRMVSAFIYSPKDVRIKNVMSRYDLTESKAKAQIDKEDKGRASYYNYYTSKKWGAMESYDICFNSSLLSQEDSVDYLVSLINKILD